MGTTPNTGDRLVCSHRASKRERRRGSRARFFLHGAWHTYLNAAVPEDGSIVESVCQQCGHGYSDNIKTGQHLCNECKLESVMAKATALEHEGVAMGAASVDRLQQRMAYGFREPALATIRY